MCVCVVIFKLCVCEPGGESGSPTARVTNLMTDFMQLVLPHLFPVEYLCVIVIDRCLETSHIH